MNKKTYTKPLTTTVHIAPVQQICGTSLESSGATSGNASTEAASRGCGRRWDDADE